MAIIKNDDIIGYVIDGEDICSKCVTQEEKKNATLDDIITENSCEIEYRYFCDRCKEDM